jgi:hypothetical protein
MQRHSLTQQYITQWLAARRLPNLPPFLAASKTSFGSTAASLWYTAPSSTPSGHGLHSSGTDAHRAAQAAVCKCQQVFSRALQDLGARHQLAVDINFAKLILNHCVNMADVPATSQLPSSEAAAQSCKMGMQHHLPPGTHAVHTAQPDNSKDSWQASLPTCNALAMVASQDVVQQGGFARSQKAGDNLKDTEAHA